MSVLFNENSPSLQFIVFISQFFFLISCVFIRCDFSNIKQGDFFGDDFSLFFIEKIEKKISMFLPKAFVLFQQRIFTLVKSKIKKINLIFF
jgi:hypothetical protein